MKRIIATALLFAVLPLSASASIPVDATINPIVPMCGDKVQEFAGSAQVQNTNTKDHLVITLDGDVIAQYQDEPTAWSATATTTLGVHELTVEWFDKPNDDDTHVYGDFTNQLFATSTEFTVVKCIDNSSEPAPVQTSGGSSSQLNPCMSDNVRGNCPDFFRGAELEHWDKYMNVDPRAHAIREILKTWEKILELFAQLNK